MSGGEGTPPAGGREIKKLGRSVALEPRRPLDANIRIRTISWSDDPRGYVPQLTVDELRRTIGAAHALSSAPEPDLILCAGRRVYTTNADDTYEPKSLLEASGGAPVVFEGWAWDVKDYGENWIAHHEGRKARATRLRSWQLLGRFRAKPKKIENRLARVIARDGGVIRFNGDAGLTLLVLMCGENNLLARDGEHASALRHRVKGLDLSALRDRWILLNPAHKPYHPQSKRKGAQKVVPVGGHRPLFERYVARDPFDDGTRPAIGIVHANNFRPTIDTTIDASAKAFSAFGAVRATGVQPAGVRLEHLAVPWRAVDFELPLRATP